jgi:hypothetical protein
MHLIAKLIFLISIGFKYMMKYMRMKISDEMKKIEIKLKRKNWCDEEKLKRLRNKKLIENEYLESTEEFNIDWYRIYWIEEFRSLWKKKILKWIS